VITEVMTECFQYDPNKRPDIKAICAQLSNLSTNSADQFKRTG